MQAILTLPDFGSDVSNDGSGELWRREVCGVPLLIRTITTAIRGGVRDLRIVYHGAFPSEIAETLRESKLLSALTNLEFISVPHLGDDLQPQWMEIARQLDDEFLWLPWNWVTNKHGLLSLKTLDHDSSDWSLPARLNRDDLPFHAGSSATLPPRTPEGVAVTSAASVGPAERWLVAHSGKPLDGIYSKFNRWLCRPLVRVLTHTPVTPNVVTLAGLAAAILGTYYFASGEYLGAVIGALLFFASGLLDEVDGMLARLKFSDSAFGTWFEGHVDNLSYLLLFAGITTGLYNQHGPRALWLGAATIFGVGFSVAVICWQRKRSTDADRPNEYLGNVYKLLDNDRANWISRSVRQVQFLIKKGVFIHYVLLFTLLGWLPAMMWFAAVGGNLTWIGALYYSRRFFRRPRPGAEALRFQFTAKENS
jgi:phosphatidylglycerophosphate synthase